MRLTRRSATQMQIDLLPYSVPFRVPLRTSVGTFAHREGVLIRLRHDGHEGVGEAAPLPGFSDEGLDEVKAALSAWRPPAPTVDVDVFEGLTGLEALLGLPSARHGAEQALLALIAAHRGCSVAEVLCARPRERVPVNALASSAADARDAVERGFSCVKVKVGYLPVDDDVARVSEVREAVGPGVAVRLDANRGWDEPTAREALRRLAPLQLEVVEEPVSGLDAMARLRSAGVPLGADESVRSESDLDDVLDAGAADVVVVKPMMVGGLVPAVRMLRRAAEAGLGGIVTTSLEGAVGRGGALAVAAACDTLPCGLDTGRLLASDVGPGFEIVGGEAIVDPRARPCP